MIGAGRGTGTTHLAIMTANYLTGVHRRRAAVLEWNRHGDFRRIAAICHMPSRTGVKGGQAIRSFLVLDAAYYPEAGGRELLSCRDQGYEEAVIDFGSIEEGGLTEFLRCDRRFLVGAMSEWRISALREFINGCEGAYKGCDILTAFGSEEARIHANKKLPVTVRRIPLSVDAFIIDSQVMAFFEQLL